MKYYTVQVTEIVTKTENQQANACLDRQAPRCLGKSFFLCHHLAVTIHPREDRLRCFPRSAVGSTACIAGGRLQRRKLRVMGIRSMPRRYSTPDRQTGGQQPGKVRIEPPNFE